MQHLEYVWSLLSAIVIVAGAVVWTTSSAPAAVAQPLAAASVEAPEPRSSSVVAWQRPHCRKFSQYEFKVGVIVTPGCPPPTH
jgi:hypothetical protein